MTVLKSKIKFQVSTKKNKEGKEEEVIIGFISKHPKTNNLKGVRENSIYGKKICLISEEEEHGLKGKVIPGVLYDVEMKPMQSGKGYVVIKAIPIQFPALVTVDNSKNIIYITFGNKIVEFNPISNKGASYNTIEGVMKELTSRVDLADKEKTIEEFKEKANSLLEQINLERNESN